MLSARAGSRGPQGEAGARGERGVGVSGARRREWEIVIELTDGKEIAVDLRGMFEDYQREAG
jgi:hypothetical protein